MEAQRDLPVAYIAGRYRGASENEVYENIQLARRCAVDCWKVGLVPLAPHMSSAFMGGVASDQAFLDGTMELLRRCDMVVLLPNWRESRGAIAEREEAFRLEIPVYAWKAEGDAAKIADAL